MIENVLGEHRSVSPVIGVILMVAIVVAIVSLVTVIVFNISGDVEDSPNPTISISETEEGITVKMIRDSKLDYINIKGQYENKSIDSVGDTKSLVGGGKYTVIVNSNNKKTVIQTTESDSTYGKQVFKNVNDKETLSIDESFELVERVVKESNGEKLDKDNDYTVDKSNDNVELSSSTNSNYSVGDDIGVIYDTESSSSNTGTTDSLNYSSPNSNPPDCSNVNYNGSGSSSDPYNISNDYELQCIESNDLSGDYQLVANIDASGTENWYSGKGFDPIARPYNSTSFEGNFYGNNHTIKGLHISRPSTNDVGLIAVGGLSQDFNNVRFKDIYIEGQNVVGPIYENVGYVENVSVLSGEIKGSQYVGGIVGNLGFRDVRNSYMNASVSGDTNVGGIMGNNAVDTNVEEVVVTGTISANDGDGPILGFDCEDSGCSSSSYSGYWDTNSTGLDNGLGVELTTSEMQGSSAETNMPNLDFSNTWETVENPDDYPRIKFLKR